MWNELSESQWPLPGLCRSWLYQFASCEHLSLCHTSILARGWVCVCSAAQLCLTLCDPMDCNPPGFSAHGIFQVRILEWVVISYSKGFFWSGDQTNVSCIFFIVGRFFTHWATKEAQGDWGGRCQKPKSFGEYLEVIQSISLRIVWLIFYGGWRKFLPKIYTRMTFQNWERSDFSWRHERECLLPGFQPPLPEDRKAWLRWGLWVRSAWPAEQKE